MGIDLCRQTAEQAAIDRCLLVPACSCARASSAGQAGTSARTSAHERGRSGIRRDLGCSCPTGQERQAASTARASEPVRDRGIRREPPASLGVATLARSDRRSDRAFDVDQGTWVSMEHRVGAPITTRTARALPAVQRGTECQTAQSGAAKVVGPPTKGPGGKGAGYRMPATRVSNERSDGPMRCLAALARTVRALPARSAERAGTAAVVPARETCPDGTTAASRATVINREPVATLRA
jgi:hypothetical protein